MGYTPTTWVSGDTVTAAKLNKMEQGIASSGGSATILYTGISNSSGSKDFGYLFYAECITNYPYWVVSEDHTSAWTEVYGHGAVEKSMDVLPLPADEKVGLFVCASAGYINGSGNIDSSPTTIHYSYGSVLDYTCYRITGDCSVEFVLS